MKKGKILFKIGLTIIILSLFSCSDEFLNTPVQETAEKGWGEASISNKLDAPKDLASSHGKKEKISLSWKSVTGASRYIIFSAESPYSEYYQSGETRETFFDYACSSGQNRYFKVVAVNHAGTKSNPSNIVFGSSLATPLITNIQSNEDGLSAIVTWWMSNCSPNTYENNVNYDIIAYSEDSNSVISNAKAEKNETSAVITGLSPKTNYRFEVQAYLNSDQGSVEISDKVDEETARRLVPQAPESFMVSKGVSTSEIELSWILPEFVDVSTGNKTYETHSLYFVISRKIKGTDDTQFQLLKRIDPENYTPGEKETFIDTTAERGIQYIYKIQSFTADVQKEISSDSSVSEAEGWLIGKAAFYVDGNYEKDGDKYTSIKFKYNLNFENHGIDYAYFVEEKRVSLDEMTSYENKYVRGSSIEEILTNERSFTEIDEAEGYYTYTIYICSAENTTFPGSGIISAVAPGKFIVTSNPSALPEINNFTVEDGYKDKYVISWDYNEDYAYILHWINKDSIEDKIEFQKNDTRLTFSEGAAIFNHEAESDESRIYTLEATNGLSVMTDDSKEYKTLGTAVPEYSEYDYENISFKWKKVQMAEDYEVHAYYTDDVSKTDLALGSEIIEEGTDSKKCMIERPAGWNNASIAGKEITVEIISKNSRSDGTKSITKTSLLGPVNTKVKMTTQTAKDIQIEWNKTAGATGYVIYRKIYSDGIGTVENMTDEIYISADGKTVVADEESVNSIGVSRAIVSTEENKIVFKDTYAEPTDKTSSYQMNQSKISWGLPFGYFVVPVKSSSDRPQYEEAVYVKGAAYGYGLNVKASKASSHDKVYISWEQPYGASTKTASLYRRPAGSTDSYWEYCTALGKTSEATMTAEDVLTETDEKLNAYEYAVLYNGTHSNGNVFASSYEEDLLSSAKKDAYSSLEPQNKGYTLALANISAQKSAGYDETVNWSVWNYSERNLGPDYYEIQIKNLNKKNDWITVARITPDVKISEDELKINDDGRTAVPVNIAANGISNLTPDVCTATLTPLFTADNVSDGVLKVLRDAKHYYRLVAYRSLPDGTVAQASVGDDTVYVYRDITKEELVRCTNFLIADALYKAGIPYKTVNSSNSKSTDGATGSFSIRGAPTSAIDYKNKVTWDFNTYKAKWSRGFCSTDSGNVESFLSLDSEASSSSEVGINGNALNFSDCQLYYLPALDIKVTSSVPLDSYKGTVNVTIGATGVSTVWNMTAKVNGEVVKTVSSNETEFLKWFPYALGTTITPSSNFDANFETYKSPWWE